VARAFDCPLFYLSIAPFRLPLWVDRCLAHSRCTSLKAVVGVGLPESGRSRAPAPGQKQPPMTGPLREVCRDA
jgi:hypothetical protein